ncbi:hypothetical protein MNBD_GAMMA01-8 [hydrothermal vent metagenome]|uniref:Uncharacterized protein n=1 Tax=hydrothermal vent metagenome TaxID=652676 RepID=A0A3B0VHG2_9ZZZZ
MKKIITLIFVVLLLVGSFAVKSHDLPVSVKLDANTQVALKREAVITVDTNGQVNMNPQGGFASTILTRIGKDGKLETFCTSSADDAKRFLAGGAVKPSIEEALQ